MTLAWWIFAAGCATPAPVSPAVPQQPAHLVVINLTDYAWRIVLTRPSGEPAHESRLQPRATAKVDLAGGDYVIEQTALSAGAAPELSRRIPAKLEPGQTYRWRLVTLLSEPAGDAGVK